MIWLPLQRPLRYWKIWYRSIIYTYRAFMRWKDCKKSVQYIRRYSTKYDDPRKHATQFPFVSLFSAETTGPIFTKILHVIVAFVLLLYFAYTRRYPIKFPNGIVTTYIGPGKTPIFRLCLVAMATSLEKSKKAQWGEQALTPIYQTWNFAEDCSINVWATWARKSTIKKIKK